MSENEKTIHFTHEQLKAMSQDDLATLLLRATKVEATAVVRRADGSIKYDRPELAGTYGEEHLHGEAESNRPDRT